MAAAYSKAHLPKNNLKRSLREGVEEFNTLSRRGDFNPSEAWLNNLNKHELFKNISFAFPRANVEHGIRIKFNPKHPYMLDAVFDAIEPTYPKAVFIDPKYLRGIIDLGFQCKEDADEAAKIPLMIKSSGVPTRVATTRTRYSGDSELFITFEDLPTSEKKENIVQGIQEGLKEYGEIVQLEFQTPYKTKLACRKAIALIRPSPEVSEDMTLIPRRAFLQLSNPDGSGRASRTFKIYPERAPPICTVCSNLGHRAEACPTTVEGLDRASDDTMEDMEDDSALATYRWGETTAYKIVEPVSNQERREANIALKKAERLRKEEEARATKAAKLEAAQVAKQQATQEAGAATTTVADLDQQEPMQEETSADKAAIAQAGSSGSQKGNPTAAQLYTEQEATLNQDRPSLDMETDQGPHTSQDHEMEYQESGQAPHLKHHPENTQPEWNFESTTPGVMCSFFEGLSATPPCVGSNPTPSLIHEARRRE